MDRSGRVSTARIVCDGGCGRDEVVVCDYERGSGGVWSANEGQANRKITGQGWELVKGKHYCPACRAQRKHQPAEEAPEMAEPKPASVTALREPTREQKRQIMSLLEVSYDTDAGRYKGTDTDHTVAAAIGAGVMPGWVAELREEFFGPDGGNGEMDALAAELKQWLADRRKDRSEAKKHIDAATVALAAVDSKIGEADAMQRRLEAIRRAVGPKAGSA